MDKIINLFIKEPEREFHIREVAKLTGKSPTTVSKYTKMLKKKGILLSKKMSNHLLFKANTESMQFKALKKEQNIREAISSGLIEYIEEELNNPEAVILFGSFAKGENIPESDIDIAVITPIKKDLSLEKFENKLGHNIQLFLYSEKEIGQMKTKNKELLNNLLNGIIIRGFWEVFK